ncbi:MAG: D-TA family PLP-dependent enzyme [Opitutales bacterium]|jgi:D-serine deaminase-like pyridoxal phosphate-dependent protein|nr:D-TA family PLP-dependent enzyme [Opitutales bacterium]MBT5168712.1 D-TA family PLP-dependent enzyme [Opitutales bacterium]MBT5815581.1 D-TA family PLP-dependent enzyme [Opitutales bacterium]MBT6379292.1 D-TA family PLP-dependent enzyme [Opitutales bacterium]MBT6768120.1 D-TA family PLP-dependent enzyme [Opitutales bacterium]
MTTPSIIGLSNADELPSPALIIYPELVKANIRQMIAIAGDPDRLRPHVKTHKMAEIVALQMQCGIRKFKCSTLAEARMLVTSEVEDMLLAYQPAGPDIQDYVQLAKENPDARFSTIVDNQDTINRLNTACANSAIALGVFLDINSGMNRTGIAPNESAAELYAHIHQASNLITRGLHVYDGHIHESNLEKRTRQTNQEFATVESLIKSLNEASFDIPKIVAGGSPTFPIHAKRDVELSPGTPLLWDFGYGDTFHDLPFQHAALLYTRVISKPAPGLLCFDLGHKAVASEMEPPRVRLLGLEDATFVSHSEEHLVLKSDRASKISVGDSFLGIPKHICPTVALYNKAAIAADGRITGYWNVAARSRILD